MREEESDLSFADFARQGANEATSENGSERLYPAPASEEVDEEAAKSVKSMARREGLSVRLRLPGVPPGSENLDSASSFVSWSMARREGFEPPTLRFEA